MLARDPRRLAARFELSADDTWAPPVTDLFLDVPVVGKYVGVTPQHLHADNWTMSNRINHRINYFIQWYKS